MQTEPAPANEPASPLVPEPTPAVEPASPLATPAVEPESPLAPKKDETQAGDKPSEVPPVQEYTAFELPEGLSINEETNTEFISLAREANLTQEQAQKLVDLNIKNSERVKLGILQSIYCRNGT